MEFVVNPDFKSHAKEKLKIGKGAMVSLSKKQKMNTKISTEDGLVGADDVSSLMIWINIFL